MARSKRATRRHHGSGERGASAVEFALVVPFLLLIIFGIIAFGLMLSFRQTMSQAATEGARAGAVEQTSTLRVSDATSATSDALSTLKIGGSTLGCSAAFVTCTVTEAACANDATHQCITVKVSYPYRSHPTISLPFINSLMPSTLSYSATAREN